MYIEDKSKFYVTRGWKELNPETGEFIKYCGEQFDDGFCYKDLEAWIHTDDEIAYISKAGLELIDSGKKTPNQVGWTKKKWLSYVKRYLKPFFYEGRIMSDAYVYNLGLFIILDCTEDDLKDRLKELEPDEQMLDEIVFIMNQKLYEGIIEDEKKRRDGGTIGGPAE